MTEQITEIESIIKELGCELYDTELASENGHAIYRVYITKKSGANNQISLDDCEKVSKILSPIYDVMPPISSDKWFLEVSSPGLERKLSKIEHFSKSIGESVKITLNDKNALEGQIIAVNDKIITLQTANGEQNVEFSTIKKAKTFIEW